MFLESHELWTLKTKTASEAPGSDTTAGTLQAAGTPSLEFGPAICWAAWLRQDLWEYMMLIEIFSWDWLATTLLDLLKEHDRGFC